MNKKTDKKTTKEANNKVDEKAYLKQLGQNSLILLQQLEKKDLSSIIRLK